MLRRRYAEEWIAAIEGWTSWARNARNLSEETVRQWLWYLRSLGEDHTTTSPWKMTTEQLYTWYGSQGWSPSTRKNVRSSMRSFYEWATSHGRTKRNPAKDLPPIKIGKRLPRPADEDVIAAALDGATHKIRLMILCGAKAGMRCSEMARLRWSDIRLDVLRVIGKGDQERYIDLHPALADELRAELARRRAGKHGTGFRFSGDGLTWVFPGKSGHMHPRWVSVALSNALGEGATAHMLRHRAATVGLEATGNLAAVQEMLGHSSPLTTKGYAHASNAARKAVIDAL